jgi:putative nucleotidyltransferase with HDIG domain
MKVLSALIGVRQLSHCHIATRVRRREERFVGQHIRLRGINGQVKGKSWDSQHQLRIGRVDSLEIVLDDSSVSRHHAEIRATDHGWRVRDLGSTNGTRLNGMRLGTGQWPLRLRDLIQFGEVAVIVEAMIENSEPAEGLTDRLRVEATAKSSWDEALQGLCFDSNRSPRPGEQLVALIRAGHHLGHHQSEDDLLRSILEDAVAVLDAQRGAIVLPDGPDKTLKLRVVATGRSESRAVAAGRDASSRVCFSQSLASRCFNRGESILCQAAEEDPELANANSIAEGAMSSVLCILLRTPRKRLGVLHLDRGPWQKPFTQDELFLGDALAANVSAGIEAAQLIRKQRDLFLNTITALAQTVELRDSCTAGHTARVTSYSALLAEQLGLPAQDLEWIRIGTPLHDIGKIGIDDAILRKPDKLTEQEFEIMKTHTVKGAEIISTVPDLHPIIPIARSHHERWDGKGYPDGLAGEDINPWARIVAVADAFDAMTSDRPYRKGLPIYVALAEMKKQTGRQFDPKAVEAFFDIRERIQQETRNHTGTQVTQRPQPQLQ